MLERRPDDGTRGDRVDLSRILTKIDGTQLCTEGQGDIVKDVIDKRIIANVKDQIQTGKAVELSYSLINVDRSVGTMLSGSVIKNGIDLEDDSVKVRFTGTAGQSFGAFLCKGITFTLEGQANDFVGKGLSGGRIAIRRGNHNPKENVIAGNTVLYGATSGELYIAGSVGERFCVRNSGATAVAEGAGDHCCEYMTGGRTVIIGDVGRNFAAGMSAGIAYVLNDSGDLDRHCNMDMVELSPVESKEDMDELEGILRNHFKYTGSRKAEELLKDWNHNVTRFLKVMPIGYKHILESS